MSEDFKLISEIKDAVNILTENKEKGFDYGNIFAPKYFNLDSISKNKMSRL
jgi:hypothetical protein